MKSTQNVILIICIIMIGCAAAAAYFFSVQKSSQTVTAEDLEISQSVEMLCQQESASVTDIENQVRLQKIQKIASRREEILQQLESDDLTGIWSLFSGTVILGNSRAESFSYYNFLPENQVYAGTGDTILKISSRKDDLVRLNPDGIFFCYGINEMSTSEWTAETFAEDYETALNDLQQALPYTTFYVSSILPTQESAYDQCAEFANVSTWNTYLKAMCDKNGYIFIDNTDVVKAHEDLYEEDGIHFQPSFFPYLAQNMLYTACSHTTRMEELLTEENSQSNSEAEQ